MAYELFERNVVAPLKSAFLKYFELQNDTKLDEIQKKKTCIKAGLDMVPNLDVKVILDSAKLVFECLPGGNAYETLVKEHSIYTQLVQENKALKEKIVELQE